MGSDTVFRRNSGQMPEHLGSGNPPIESSNYTEPPAIEGPTRSSDPYEHYTGAIFGPNGREFTADIGGISLEADLVPVDENLN